jgi:hypothetical protein
MLERDLTICTVSFESGPFLAHNVPLVRMLNPDSSFVWRVAENSPLDSNERVDASLEIEVVDGVDVPDVRYQAASYHHGAALNELVARAETRHILLMDPDFFVVRSGWIDSCRHHVLEHELTFLGAPWHPRWISKPRGFPAPHFLWIDTARVAIDALDLLPAGDLAPWEQVFHVSRSRRAVDKLAGGIVPDWMERRKVGRSRDTGWRVHERFSATAAHECLVPYYSPVRHRPGGAGSRTSRLADRLLGASLRLVPEPGTFSEHGFAGAGLPDLDARGWEEFMWCGQPFAFHVRGYPRRAKGQQARGAADDLAEVLARILPRGPAS